MLEYISVRHLIRSRDGRLHEAGFRTSLPGENDIRRAILNASCRSLRHSERKTHLGDIEVIPGSYIIMRTRLFRDSASRDGCQVPDPRLFRLFYR